MHQTAKKPRGFTLLEILVVLTIIGLLSGVALPQLQNLATSVEISNQRTAIMLSIESLGYQTYVSGKPLVLSEAKFDKKGLRPEQPLQIPEGWRLQVSQPIIYAINGVCGGGKVTIIDPRNIKETFQLSPPQCHLNLIENSE